MKAHFYSKEDEYCIECENVQGIGFMRYIDRIVDGVHVTVPTYTVLGTLSKDSTWFHEILTEDLPNGLTRIFIEAALIDYFEVVDEL